MSIAFVSGALANKPFNGGNAWSRLSWVVGLRRLGVDALFVEEIRERDCVDAAGAPCSFAASANLAYFRGVMDQFGLAALSSLLCDGGAQVHGLPLPDLLRRAGQADFLFNLSGHLALPELKRAVRCRVYFDDDPGYTQFWHADGGAGARLGDHDLYFTLGANIGSADCAIPVGNIPWLPIRPPVVLAEWPACLLREFDGFTTVASWRGAYGPVQHGGKSYGLKVHEFRKFLELPERTGLPFEIALHIHPADHRDLAVLQARRWRIADPRAAAGTPDQFRQYVQRSAAEFSVAQGIYVETHSGWFSDRTVRYLASGRPALVQDTGFSPQLPVGEGLLAFRTLDEAVEGARRIAADYPRHCRAARRIAEDHFCSDRIIRGLLERIGGRRS